MSTLHSCDEGWVCEKHPDKEWPHDVWIYGGMVAEECSGPGEPCRYPGCEKSMLNSVEFREGMAQGLADLREGNTKPWSQVKKELGLDAAVLDTLEKMMD